MTALDADVALQLFSAQRVAVLGTVRAAAAPHLVPVTFAMIDAAVVFAVDHKPKSTTRLSRLQNIAGNSAVSFLVDRYDDDWRRLWWVRVDAEAAIVTAGVPGDRYDRALDALAAKYPQYQQLRPTGAVVIARVVAVVGWAFTAVE